MRSDAVKTGMQQAPHRSLFNALGMTKEELEHIFDKKTYTPGSGGVGVRNVQNRLQLYYGAEYGLHYVSEKGSGTTVYVRIPTGEGRVNEDM